jgi:thiol:disulfide interchange protein
MKTFHLPMKRYLLLSLAMAFFVQFASAQVLNPVKWKFEVRDIGQNQVDLIFKASISHQWHMYGLNIPDGGPIPLTIDFTDPKGYEKAGKPLQIPKPHSIDDPVFNMRVELHTGQVTFTQRIRKTQADSIVIAGTLNYMTCNDAQCVPGDKDFTFKIKGTEAKPAARATAKARQDTLIASATHALTDSSSAPDTTSASVSAITHASGNKATRKTLWEVFFYALMAGLGAVLTPCVYPMIPMTVSYFLRKDKPRSKGISEAIVFGLSIVFIYTSIGALVAIFKNPNAVNDVTTYWLTNLIFFSIFIILAASFFGMFEIMLPSGLANKVDQKADKGGYAGAFFMALAMAILSFSCTGPIIGALLVKASQGDLLEPIIGMAGFSIMLALPFTLLAIFPSMLQKLPKSGGWLNGVKVFFAFVMLAFSIYFLGKIDQSYNLHLLNRNLFISIWVVIFTLLGFYLLGKIRFPHDSDLHIVGVPRFIFAVAVFSFALYLFTGIFGSELKALSTILPPPEASAEAGSGSVSTTGTGLCSVPKYAGFLDLPHQLKGYFDYNEALACAREKGKPVLIDFVGHTCSNCKKMYAEVWSDPRVLQLLNERFVIVALYTDDWTKLPEKEWVTSKVDGKVKKTLGKKNQDFEVGRFRSNALPLYAIVDADGKDLTASYYTYNPDVEQMIRWLKEGLKKQGPDR